MRMCLDEADGTRAFQNPKTKEHRARQREFSNFIIEQRDSFSAAARDASGIGITPTQPSTALTSWKTLD